MPSDIDQDDPDQRIIEAWYAVRKAPGLVAITGWAALRWLGGTWFDGLSHGGRRRTPVVVLSMSRLRNQPGILISEERPAHHLFVHDGVVVTDPLRSVIYEARYASSARQALVALEMAMYADLVSLDEIAESLPSYNGWTGVGQPRRAMTLADENVWSPQESKLKWEWVRLGFPKPLCNRPLFDPEGRHLATPDLFDPETGLAGEYDGAFHLAGEQRRVDRAREEMLRDHGVEMVTVMAGELGEARTAQRLESGRLRARRLPASGRNWTLEPPPWWIPTWTVAQRRALDQASRARLLAHRAG